MPARDRDAIQLRAVAPLVVRATRQLLGPTMIVTSGHKTIAVTSAELIRQWDASKLAIVTSLDGATMIPVGSWGVGRYSGLGLIELEGDVVAHADLTPLDLGSVCATAETRGSPAALVTITSTAGRFERTLIPVYVDSVDPGGMSDDALARLASPIDPAHGAVPIEGAILFAWFPPDPVLGRPREVLAAALAFTYHHKAFQPRATPAIGELVGLEDIGRALISKEPAAERAELHEVVGEVESREAVEPVIEGPDEYRKKRERS